MDTISSLRNVSYYLPINMASYPWRLDWIFTVTVYRIWNNDDINVFKIKQSSNRFTGINIIFPVVSSTPLCLCGSTTAKTLATCIYLFCPLCESPPTFFLRASNFFSDVSPRWRHVARHSYGEKIRPVLVAHTELSTTNFRDQKYVSRRQNINN